MNKSQVKGLIKYYGLTDWWVSTFTEQERAYIEASQEASLTTGDIVSSTQGVGLFLSNLSGWFKKTDQDRDIARRILAQALKTIGSQTDILDAHFLYQSLIQAWYRDRDALLNALDEAIKACEAQIAIAPQAARQFKREYPKSPLPAHVGYTQLAIIYDKKGRYDEAIQVAQQAKKQGWNDDWAGRIERYEKKRDKPKKP